MSPDLDWRKREIAYHNAFPQSTQLILVVVDGPTPELASAATHALTQELAKKNDVFRSVDEQGGDAFFRRNGLLFASPEQLEGMTSRLTSAAPLVGTLSSDPSLRGLVQTLSFVLAGVEQGQVSLDDTARVLNAAAEPIEKAAAGEPADFSWKTLLQGSAQSTDLRRYIAIRPYLNENELQPGARATGAIRRPSATSSSMRPIGRGRASPDPFRSPTRNSPSTTEGLALNSALTRRDRPHDSWIALASWRLVLAVVSTIAAGLVVTAGLGLLLVGALNPISVAFAILFVGLGADFGIQYTMRYRAQRHVSGPLHRGLDRGRGARRRPAHAGGRRGRCGIPVVPADALYRHRPARESFPDPAWWSPMWRASRCFRRCCGSSIRRRSRARCATRPWRRSTTCSSGIAF